MKLIQLISGHLTFAKRVSDAEDAIDALRRMVRSQDLEISDALEKMQRLTARLAKRSYRGSEVAPPPDIDAHMANAAVPDAISARILERRRKTTVSTLAEEAGNGLVPKR